MANIETDSYITKRYYENVLWSARIQNNICLKNLKIVFIIVV